MVAMAMVDTENIILDSHQLPNDQLSFGSKP